MNKAIIIFFLISIIQYISYGSVNPDTIKTKIINVINKKDIYNMKLNFCDSFSIEFKGLYPILNELPLAKNEKTILRPLLEKKGFIQVDAGWGNWELGPRFLYLKYNKGNCNCTIVKKYYYNKKAKEGYFDLSVTERLICNSAIFMDD